MQAGASVQLRVMWAEPEGRGSICLLTATASFPASWERTLPLPEQKVGAGGGRCAPAVYLREALFSLGLRFLIPE